MDMFYTSFFCNEGNSTTVIEKIREATVITIGSVGLVVNLLEKLWRDDYKCRTIVGDNSRNSNKGGIRKQN